MHLYKSKFFTCELGPSASYSLTPLSADPGIFCGIERNPDKTLFSQVCFALIFGFWLPRQLSGHQSNRRPRCYRFDGVVGYRICLTHRRSPVRTWLESFFCSFHSCGGLIRVGPLFPLHTIPSISIQVSGDLSTKMSVVLVCCCSLI